MAAKSATPAAGDTAGPTLWTPPAPAGRRLAAGAEVQPGGGVHFRVWAPRRARVQVVLDPGPQGASGPSRVALVREAGGYFSGYLPDAPAGTRYRFRLDNLPMLYPDPASRYQPEGPLGPSEVVDPGAYAWRDDAWPGAALAGRVAYEMHVGTFTPEGTWAAATAELAELASAGISLVEVMPVAEFPGRFGWGYDGVDLFAPSHLYGAPDDFRRFVDEAHGHKMAVILDVVYNHLGPTGNYLRVFADDYLSRRHSTEWGDAINFDGPNHGPVRDFFLDNAAYWIDEFHLDGLRLDATQAIFDDSHEHILAAVAARVRQA
ncbi:MAG: alpha-amylase family glycosyl hydrolase, partial [Pirellulales bacterium]